MRTIVPVFLLVITLLFHQLSAKPQATCYFNNFCPFIQVKIGVGRQNVYDLEMIL